jgi:CDP-diacylglycerol--glycerol-3-phosphate 3-phosphatidyltransferase
MVEEYGERRRTQSLDATTGEPLRAHVNLPTAITLVRFPLAVAFPLVEGLVGRVLIVGAAAASEWIDGRLARATGQVTRAGELLDPIADKTFVLVVLLTLALEGAIPPWTLPLLLARDIGVAIGAAFLTARGVRTRLPARPAGKLVTWLQFAAVAAMLPWPAIARYAAPAIALFGIVAVIDYARALRPALRSRPT